MPIQKFRSYEEAKRALWTDSSDPAIPMRMRRLWEFMERLCRHKPPRGVQKFRSIEEANRERASWPRA